MSDSNQSERSIKQKNPRWFWSKVSDDWLLAEVIIFTLLVISSYVFYFHDNDLAKEPSGWANFATFISGTVGVFVVASTLIVLIRNLEKQSILIDNQEDQLQQSKTLIKIEREKMKEVSLGLEKEKRYAAIYLFHRFEKIENFYEKSVLALKHKDASKWQAIAQKHPALIDDFLLDEKGELVPLLNKMDSQLALDCIGAVDFYKEVFAVIKSALTEEAIFHDYSNMTDIELKSFSEIRREETLDIALKGQARCKSFLKHARLILEEERSI